MSLEELIIVKPEDISSRSRATITDGIIQTLIRKNAVNVAGISTAISVACSAISRAKELANVNIHEITIDYLKLGLVGKFDSILFELSTSTPEHTIEEKMKALDSDMDLSFTEHGQTVVIPKKERPERLTSLALSKLQKFSKIKILAAGMAINSGVSVALQVARSGISKQKVGILLVGLGSVKSQFQNVGSVTSIEIYLEKGKETEYSEHHKKLIELMTQG